MFIGVWVALGALLASCGGGGGAGASGGGAAAISLTGMPIALPPGDGRLDLSSVVGIDANANGVRDDVEIAMAKAVVTDGPTWQGVLRLGRLYQDWLAHPSADPNVARARLLDEYRGLLCLEHEASASGAPFSALARELGWRTFSTRERMAIRRATQRAAGPFLPPALDATC